MHVDDERPHHRLPREAEGPAARCRASPDIALASMGIYVFETTFLFDQLRRDAADPNSSHDFGKDIIPYLVKQRQGGRASLLAVLRALAARRRKPTGATSARSTPIGRPISTSPTSCPTSTSTTATGRSGPMARSRRRPSSCTTSTAGAAWRSPRWSRAAASSRAPSLQRSLLFTGVRVHSYSHDRRGGDPALRATSAGTSRLNKVVIDRGVRIPDGLVVGEDPELDAKRFRRTEEGVCLITQPMIDRLTP